MSGSFGSKESIDKESVAAATGSLSQEGGTPMSVRRELSDSPSVNSVRDLVSRISSGNDTPPPPASRRAKLPGVQLKDGPPTDSSSS
ncbi:hypothetical protein EMCRGX_G028770 [Ephydatia muelleri]